MNQYSDYELYKLIEENGYEPSKENLITLKESIECGDVLILNEGIKQYSQDKIIGNEIGVKKLTAPALMSIFFGPWFLIWLGLRIAKNNRLTDTQGKHIKDIVARDSEARDLKSRLDAAVRNKDKATAKELSVQFADKVNELLGKDPYVAPERKKLFK